VLLIESLCVSERFSIHCWQFTRELIALDSLGGYGSFQICLLDFAPWVRRPIVPYSVRAETLRCPGYE